MSKIINIPTYNAITLNTANKYCEEDITITLDSTLIPTGTIDITSNGTHDVTNYATASVNVPIPEGYIIPEGTLNITANGDYDAAEYASVSVAVEGGGSSGPSFVDYVATKGTDLSYLFSGNTSANLDEYITLLDSSKVTRMPYMFDGCSSLVSVPYFDTSKLTYANYMFNGCVKLQTVPYFKLAGVASFMFNSCSSLTSIKLDSTAGTMSRTFSGCSKLQTIDVTSMDNCTSTTDTNSICNNCYSLTKFIIRSMAKAPALNSNAFNNCYHFTGTTNSNYNPSGLKDGRIYVPDAMVDTLKAATNWSTYADIIVPLSTLEE